MGRRRNGYPRGDERKEGEKPARRIRRERMKGKRREIKGNVKDGNIRYILITCFMYLKTIA